MSILIPETVLHCLDYFSVVICFGTVFFFSVSSFLENYGSEIDFAVLCCCNFCKTFKISLSCLQKRHLDFLRIALNLQINFESISILTILNLPIICWRCLYIYVDHSFNNVVLVFSVYLTLLFIKLCLNIILFLWCHNMEILPDKYTLLS